MILPAEAGQTGGLKSARSLAGCADYDGPVPQFDAPHQQPEQPPPSTEKLARKVPIALIVTIAVTVAAVGLLVWLVWSSMSGA